ncbi:MAG: 3-oxoacyl-ACP synthase, partial [Paludibacteraceae bacterium]|nr:3-oxoacyl-ACP synthase [Paludibacteraceae bacterium]
YPKFHKMDTLCKAGFVAAELLLMAEGKIRFEECENRAVVLFNRASSLNADRKHQQSIQNMEDFYPSPAVFVYTLPNIITGEIAIRNKYYGETSFYVLADKNEELMKEICVSAFEDKMTQSMITGWVDCEDDDNFEVDMSIREKK